MLVERYIDTYYITAHLQAYDIFSSFFNKLKTNPRYLNHKVNTRCDDLFEVLLSIEKDMFFE